MLLYDVQSQGCWNEISREQQEIEPPSFEQRMLSAVSNTAFLPWMHAISRRIWPSGAPSDLRRAIQALIPWHIARLASPGHDAVAVWGDRDVWAVQGSNVPLNGDPIWHSPLDSHPESRHLAWSLDGSVLAACESSGLIHVLSAAQGTRLGLPGVRAHVAHTFDFGNEEGVVAIAYRGRSELVVLTFAGHLHRIHTPPFESNPPSIPSLFLGDVHAGVTAMTVSPDGQRMLVGGWRGRDAGTPPNPVLGPAPSPLPSGLSRTVAGARAASSQPQPPREGTALVPDGTSLSLWQLTDSPPFVQMLYASTSEAIRNKRRAQRLSLFSGAFKRWWPPAVAASQSFSHLAFSPGGGDLLAGIDIAGRLSLWDGHTMDRRGSWTALDIALAIQTASDHTLREDTVAKVVDISWWSPSALVLSLSSGLLYVADIQGLVNVLGRTEQFDWPPRLSSAFAGSFHILEGCRRRVHPAWYHRPEGRMDDEDDEVVETALGTRAVGAVPGRGSSAIHVDQSDRGLLRPLDSVSDAVDSHGRSLKRCYSLHRLCRLSPEDLLSRRIASGQFDEALALAARYDLDPDPAYKHRWEHSTNVSRESIALSLHQVKDEGWVLEQCRIAAPSTDVEQERILRYGLTRCRLDSLPDDAVVWDDLDLPSIPTQHPPIFSDLSPRDRRRMQYRLVFLQYLDRLSSVRLIRSGLAPDGDGPAYMADEFSVFRQCDLAALACQFASLDSYSAVRILFMHHPSLVLPYRLSILSSAPETTPPESYADLLPSLNEQAPPTPREIDFAESPFVLDSLKLGAFDSFSKQLGPPFDKLPPLAETLAADWPLAVQPPGSLQHVLGAWYRTRALEIEERSGQVGNARALIRLAKEKGVTDGLDHITAALDALYTAVYSQGEHNLTLASLLSSPPQAFSLLANVGLDRAAAGAQAALLVHNIRTLSLPFAADCLRNDVMERARAGRLDHVAAICKASRCTLPSAERLIPKAADLISIALEALYTCNSLDSESIQHANAIFECLPSRNATGTHGPLAELHDRVDRLDSHLTASEALIRWSSSKPLSFFSGHDAEGARALLRETASRAARRRPKLTDIEWGQLLDDLVLIQDQAFPTLLRGEAAGFHTRALLSAGLLDAAHRALARTDAKDADVAVRACLEAAQEFANSASSVDDAVLSSAQRCLALPTASGVLSFASPHVSESLVEEANFIATVRELDAVGVHVVPLQVRLSADRMAFVKQAASVASLSPLVIVALAKRLGCASPGEAGEAVGAVAIRCSPDLGWAALAPLMGACGSVGMKVSVAIEEAFEKARVAGRTPEGSERAAVDAAAVAWRETSLMPRGPSDLEQGLRWMAESSVLLAQNGLRGNARAALAFGAWEGAFAVACAREWRGGLPARRMLLAAICRVAPASELPRVLAQLRIVDAALLMDGAGGVVEGADLEESELETATVMLSESATRRHGTTSTELGGGALRLATQARLKGTVLDVDSVLLAMAASAIEGRKEPLLVLSYLLGLHDTSRAVELFEEAVQRDNVGGVAAVYFALLHVKQKGGVCSLVDMDPAELIEKVCEEEGPMVDLVRKFR